MKSLIRNTKPKDFQQIEEILRKNIMLTYPEVDGKDAMMRIHERMGDYFLVSEFQGDVIGMIRGSYDGSRAVIHQIAVDPLFHNQGIGKSLIHALAMKFKNEGASTISVTTTDENAKYFENLSFYNEKILLLICSNIDEVILQTETKDNSGY